MTIDAAPAAKPNELQEIAKTVVAALAIALALRVLLFQPFTIPSDSMEPGLLTGDYVVTTKFDYGWSRYSIPLGLPLFKGRIFGRDPQRGDVIVFKLPRDTHQDYVKRLIGLPGDRVQLKGGTVFVNGRAIPRTPIGPAQDPGSPEVYPQQVVETQGAHRYITFDRGEAHDGDDTEVFVVPERHYFMMGDNRDNSLDSRWPPEVLGVGLVPAENLEGRARFILMSWQPGASILKPWTWLNLRPSRFLRAVS
jgi:signal peptidase I